MSYAGDKDNELRSEFGVVVTLSPDRSGSTKLVLDDVRDESRVGSSHAWEHQRLYTVAEFETNGLESLELTRDELALLGENLLMRLLALNRRGRDAS